MGQYVYSNQTVCIGVTDSPDPTTSTRWCPRALRILPTVKGDDSFG